MIKSLIVVLALATTLSGCDRVNRANRTLDTMLGGDFQVYVQGIEKPFIVTNGKVTSIPEKGYYVFYPEIDGKKRLVQSPIQITTVIKMN